MASVSVHRLTRRFAEHTALDDVSIEFPSGELYALLGPSGSGKTTLLRLIAGFDFPDEGEILIDGESVARVPVEARRIGMVFQSYALFPNLDVARNVAFGLEVRAVARGEIRRRVGDALALVQLDGLERRRPHELSGGQRQRVALARAIVTEPRVLLLDEPLGALDKALRRNMQVELRRIQRETGITTIFVTHDQEEALTLSDRVGILRDGRLVQEGAPDVLYDRPRDAFAATFLGNANLFRGTVADGAIVLADGTRIRSNMPLPANGCEASCAVRPERMRLAPRDGIRPDAHVNRIAARVAARVFTGPGIAYTLAGSDGRFDVLAPNTGERPVGTGERVEVSWSAASTIVFDQATRTASNAVEKKTRPLRMSPPASG